jgi:uncharacterized protein
MPDPTSLENKLSTAESGGVATARSLFSGRTVEELRAAGNGLANEPSLYLQQHARNPIDWQPWNAATLARIRALDAPVFLSIGYASCHWCHVMEHEVFEKENVAAFVNARFVSIKVDREELPGIDKVYMDAVQAMTGSGGWPMTVFLTPSLEPFYGGTYFPEGQFMRLAQRIAEVFATQRGDLEKQARELTLSIAADPTLRFEPAPIADADILKTAQTIIRHADDRWGGLESHMKFPTPLRWRYLLRHLRKTGDAAAVAPLRTTLDRMADGGLRDQLGGGFCRYTVEETWLVPHFEKMLYDNAQLVGLYIEAAAALGEPHYADVARDTLRFMQREWLDAGGGFYASYDADSGGHEGSFYLWTPEQIEAVVGPADAPALCALLDVRPGGNFEGATILTRRVDPKKVSATFNRTQADIGGLFEKHREGLYAARAQRTPPGLDRKIVTAWNGLALSAFAEGAAWFNDPGLLEAATRTAEFLLRVHVKADGTLYRVSNGGRPQNEGILEDYALLATGLFELHQASQDPRWLAAALNMVAKADELFARPDGGYYLTPDNSPSPNATDGPAPDAPLGRAVEIFDSVQPSGTAALVHLQVRLAALTGHEDLAAKAERTLTRYAGWFAKAGLEMCTWLDAARLFKGPVHEVVIAGDPAAPDTRALADVLRRTHAGHVVWAAVGPEGATGPLAELAPALTGKGALDTGEGATAAAAWVCRRGVCLRPVTTPGELGLLIAHGWA